MAIDRLVVGLDGSEQSGRALTWAAGLARDLGAEVVAVHGMGLLEDRGDGVRVPAESIRDEVAAKLEGEWCEPLRVAGVRHRAELVGGEPVGALLAAAERHRADLIVVGSRGTSGFSALHLGSTSHQVALRAACPVVIIPAAPEAAG